MSLATTVLERVQLFIPVLLSLSVHEWAHAFAAKQLGDTTAEEQGRLTLNPIAHMDVVGTLALPLLGVPFGWAKPVPVEPTRFRPGVSMSFGMLIAAAAGPVSNGVLALVCGAGLLLARRANLAEPGGALEALLSRAVLVNIALGVFNLLPIPPLDGSRIVEGLVPFEYRGMYRKVGIVLAVVLALVFLAPLLPLGTALLQWVRGL